MDVPVQSNRFWKTREEAKRCPIGSIRLGYCPVCDFVTNLSFEPAKVEYAETYENSLHFSPFFQDYARSLAVDLIDCYDLHGKRLIEIGCGKGDFLVMLCKLGDNYGVGFDPAYVQQEDHKEMEGKVEFVKDLYSERYIDYEADVIVCRQTLEHIPDPRAFLTRLSRFLATSNKRAVHVFFEVPNALHVFRKLSIWDIIYEHCSYFTSRSMLQVFSLSGFQIHKLTKEFGDQYLCIYTQPNTGDVSYRNHKQIDAVDSIADDVVSFTANYEHKIKEYRKKLKQIEDRGERVVIWGAGSKGVTFLNAFKDQCLIEYAVDINPRKQGMFIPGTGQRIVSPKFLLDYRPDVTIIMNPIYQTEIKQLTNKLGLTTRFLYG
jgi:SAM-dependent methyltransferase